jgi:hypothetical protein
VADSLGIQVWYLLAGIFSVLMGFLIIIIRPVAQLEEVMGAELEKIAPAGPVVLPAVGQD